MEPILSYTLLSLIIIVALSIGLPGIAGAVWLPTPQKDIEPLFKTAGVKEGSLVYDLGCGDARVLIYLAKTFGAKGVGIEIDPLKVLLAKFFVWRAGLSREIKILFSSAKSTKLHDADFVYFYLSHQAIDALSEKLKQELKPNAVIISYRFLLRGFKPVFIYGDKKGFIYKMSVGQKVDTLL